MTNSQIFLALSDEIRRQILDLLRVSGALRASDIAAQFPQVTRNAISKHLRVLREAKLIQQVESNDGRERLYGLDRIGLIELNDWLEPYHAYWENQLVKLKHLVENPDD